MHDDPHTLSRREVLAGATGAAVSLAAPSLACGAATGDGRPTVMKASSELPVDSLLAHPHVLGELFEAALARLADVDTPADAWQRLLSSDDVVGLKFNQSGAYGLQTTPPLARALVKSLEAAGWPRDRIVLIEVSSALTRELKTQPPVLGWSKTEHDFGSGKDQLAAVLDQVTALVNVPFIKTHNIAGMTGCLKNLSHGLVRHPARYHANGCLPYIADIVALPAIRDKLKLNVMNVLRAVWNGGPEVQLRYRFDARTLLLSTDPVAADSVAVDLLDEHRAKLRIAPIGGQDGMRALWDAAAARQLGQGDRDYIRRRHVRM